MPGLEHVTLSMSAGEAGFRLVSVLLDQTGKPIGASDGVLYRQEVEAPGARGGAPTMAWLHESLSGRFDGGSFRGTRWVSTTLVGADRNVPDHQRAPFEVTAAEARVLKALVDEVLRRLPPAASA
jgi:hypothetical protein